MTKSIMQALVAMAAIGASAGSGYSSNAVAYNERKETQRAEQAKALSKKGSAE